MHYEIAILFFFVALIYSSVGFGGGSSYLAILALYGMPFQEMRLTALVCNIIVVTGGTIHYFRKNLIDWKKTAPLVIASVPLAFAGAKYKWHEDAWFITLGCCLIVAAFLLLIKSPVNSPERKVKTIWNAVTGGGIGFLSGMVGIGGGIFLSPFLNLTRGGNSKEIAATSSVFILVNSLAGIGGQLSFIHELRLNHILLPALAVFAGGQLGSAVGIMKFNMQIIRRITAAVILIAGIEVLLKHL